MKVYYALALIMFSSWSVAQHQQYEPSAQLPYGMLNPEAPEGTGDFDMLIGTCDCISVSRNPDGHWQDSLRIEWQFKYIMNGTAVQDELWRENSLMAGSIRQFNTESNEWHVAYYTSANIPVALPSWIGAINKDGDIVLNKDQKAPNGGEGNSRLTFYDISTHGFKWKAEWLSIDESVRYPFRSITCTKKSN